MWLPGGGCCARDGPAPGRGRGGTRRGHGVSDSSSSGSGTREAAGHCRRHVLPPACRAGASYREPPVAPRSITALHCKALLPRASPLQRPGRPHAGNDAGRPRATRPAMAGRLTSRDGPGRAARAPRRPAVCAGPHGPARAWRRRRHVSTSGGGHTPHACRASGSHGTWCGWGVPRVRGARAPLLAAARGRGRATCWLPPSRPRTGDLSGCLPLGPAHGLGHATCLAASLAPPAGSSLPRRARKGAEALAQLAADGPCADVDTGLERAHHRGHGACPRSGPVDHGAPCRRPFAHASVRHGRRGTQKPAYARGKAPFLRRGSPWLRQGSAEQHGLNRLECSAPIGSVCKFYGVMTVDGVLHAMRLKRHGAALCQP